MENSLKEKINFIMKLGESFHCYGASAYRIEIALSNVSKALGLNAQFFFTPTYMMGAFKVGDSEESRHLRVVPGDICLNKLCRVDEIGDAVISGTTTVLEGSEQLSQVAEQPQVYGAIMKIISTAFVAGSVSLILRPELKNAIASMFVAVIVGIIHFFSARIPKMKDLFEVIVAFIAAICSYSLCLIYKELYFSVVLLSSLIVLIPGLSLTTAIAELARNHLASGTARLMGSLISLIKFSFGVVLGMSLMKVVGNITPPNTGIFVSNTVIWLSFVLAGLSFSVLFEARVKDTIWIVFACLISIFSSKLGHLFVGENFSALIGGMIIGSGANIFARIFKRPASVILIPGVIFLVPGSMGYKAFSLLYGKDFLLGVESAFTMIAVALSLVTGLLIGHLIIDPKRSL